MKKITISLMILCVTLGTFLPARAAEKPEAGKTGTLTVIIDGFPNNNGNARITLCDTEAGCKGEKVAFRGDAIPIREKMATWLLPDLPWGTYAIKAFHDENGNGKLDKNALGMPKEAYGFSNNARGAFGPPSYESMTFKLDRTQKTIRITVK